jgi:hypothetical protein
MFTDRPERIEPGVCWHYYREHQFFGFRTSLPIAAGEIGAQPAKTGAKLVMAATQRWPTGERP